MSVPGNQTASVLLLDLATALTLCAALVYAAGWTYAYHYFGNFSLGLLMLEIPVRYYFMYGFWVIKEWWWVLGLLYVLLLLPYPYRQPWLWPWLHRCKKEQPLLCKHLQVLAVLLAFLAVWWLATLSADGYYREQQDSNFAAYPHVRVWPRPPLPEDVTLRTLYVALPEGSYRLLLQNQDKLFVFKPPRDRKPARLAVIELALRDVHALRVLP